MAVGAGDSVKPMTTFFIILLFSVAFACAYAAGYYQGKGAGLRWWLKNVWD